MYNNVGRTIMTVARIITWLGIIVSFILFCLTLSDGDGVRNRLAFVILIIGCIGSWLSSLILYGFGQLIENSDIIAKKYGNESLPSNENKDNISNEKTANNTVVDVSVEKERLKTWLRIGAITPEEYEEQMRKLDK